MIDTESLCLAAGPGLSKVWCISCDVTVLDSSGGNVCDVTSVAAMAALRAYRKPEVSYVPVEGAEKDATAAG